MVRTVAASTLGAAQVTAPSAPAHACDDVPVVLTAQPLLRARPELDAALRAARLNLRAVASWERLPDGIERIAAALVLVDLDAADRASVGGAALSGHRIVSLLARRLAGRGVALVVLTRLDFAEIEDLARAGVTALVPSVATTKVLVAHLRAALARRVREHRRQAATAAGANPPASVVRAPRPRDMVAGAGGRCRVSAPHPPVDDWRLPDALWHHLASAIPHHSRAVRTRVSDRQVLEALVYRLRTGTPWSALPRAFGSPQTIRRRLRAWRESGVLARMQTLAARERSYLGLLDWDRLAHAPRRSAPPRATAAGARAASHPCRPD